MKFLLSQAYVIVTLLLPSVAWAHSGAGEGGGWMYGLSHPLSGLDHACAMIAVGLWAAQMGEHAMWRVPLAFVSVMILGGLAGMAGIHVSFIEAGIAMSLLVLGVLIAAAARLPLQMSVAIVAAFALFHGYAHGAEIPRHTAGLAYVAGFVLATAMLHVSGISAALILKRLGRAMLVRAAGAAVAVCGGYLWLAA